MKGDIVFDNTSSFANSMPHYANYVVRFETFYDKQTGKYVCEESLHPKSNSVYYYNLKKIEFDNEIDLQEYIFLRKLEL